MVEDDFLSDLQKQASTYLPQSIEREYFDRALIALFAGRQREKTLTASLEEARRERAAAYEVALGPQGEPDSIRLHREKTEQMDGRIAAEIRATSAEAEIARLREGLERIERWELPIVKSIFEGQTVPYGQSGRSESEYIRGIARDLLSQPAAPSQPDAIRKAVEEETDRCAKLIEQNSIMDSGGEKFLRPRHDGDVNGLAYADAIRARSTAAQTGEP